MLKVGSNKPIGTPVRCPSCRYRNLAIDIWCERCGTPLDWKKTDASVEPSPVLHAVAPPPGPVPDHTVPAPRRSTGFKLALPSITLRSFSKPAWMAGLWAMPRFALRRIAVPRLRRPVIPHLVWVVALVLVVLLLVPLAYVILPATRSVAERHAATTQRQPADAGKGKGSSPQAAAIAAVEAKTGLKYSSQCATATACLSIADQTIGKDAAAIVFVTAQSGGRQCVAYVYHKSGGWHLQDAACALPGQISPLVGREAIVHVPGSCANVRDDASLAARVVTCLRDGTTVHVVGGPIYADDFMWWRTDKGWMAHDFLVAP